jgi:hypothetical protein
MHHLAHPGLSDRALPRVSCIMPTADRRAFVRIALDLFAAQTYPNRELIVVDDGRDGVEDLCLTVPDVVYVRVPPQSIGARRNIAVEHASGEIIVHWDDDDWYSPERLRLQVEPILAGTAGVTGLENRVTLVLRDRSFWTSSDALHARMFVGDVHGGTLAFSRQYFERGVRYPDTNLAEDAALLRQLLQLGARLEKIPNEGSFVYVRHGRNAWSFEAGRFLDPAGWRRCERPEQMPLAMLERYGDALGERPTATLRASEPGMVDCLGSTQVEGSAPVVKVRRCVAFVASEACSGLLDAALTSLNRHGGVDDAARVVFVVGAAPACEQVARRHGAIIISTRALTASGPSLKAALYSMAHVVQAHQYLCLDADLLVLGDVSTLFDQHAALGPGRMLIGPEFATDRGQHLGDAIGTIYRGSASEIVQLTGGDSASSAYPQVVNDGVFVADRGALLAIDAVLRAAPDIGTWVHARPDVWWRQKAALNIALARLDAAARMRERYNVQLHSAAVEPMRSRPGVALWQGEPATVLHFNGAGRRQHAAWKGRILGRARVMPRAPLRQPRVSGAR